MSVCWRSGDGPSCKVFTVPWKGAHAGKYWEVNPCLPELTPIPAIYRVHGQFPLTLRTPRRKICRVHWPSSLQNKVTAVNNNGGMYVVEHIPFWSQELTL
ncbi:hypothetical protein FKM82_023936 [Ascaphus truei]